MASSVSVLRPTSRLRAGAMNSIWAIEPSGVRSWSCRGSGAAAMIAASPVAATCATSPLDCSDPITLWISGATPSATSALPSTALRTSIANVCSRGSAPTTALPAAWRSTRPCLTGCGRPLWSTFGEASVIGPRLPLPEKELHLPPTDHLPELDRGLCATERSGETSSSGRCQSRRAAQLARCGTDVVYGPETCFRVGAHVGKQRGRRDSSVGGGR